MPISFNIKTVQNLKEEPLRKSIKDFVMIHPDSPVQQPEIYFTGEDKAIHIVRDETGGILGLGFTHSLPEPGSWKLNAAIVHRDHRNKDIGTAILRHAILWLKGRNAKRIALPVTNLGYAEKLVERGLPVIERTPSQIVFEVAPASPDFNKILKALKEGKK